MLKLTDMVLSAMLPEQTPRRLCAIGIETLPCLMDIAGRYPAMEIFLSVHRGEGREARPGINITEESLAFPLQTLEKADEADCLVVCGIKGLLSGGRKLIYETAAAAGAPRMLCLLPLESDGFRGSQRYLYLLEAASILASHGYAFRFIDRNGCLASLEQRGISEQILDRADLVALVAERRIHEERQIRFPRTPEKFKRTVYSFGESDASISSAVMEGVTRAEFLVAPFNPRISADCVRPGKVTRPTFHLPADYTPASCLITSGDSPECGFPVFPDIERLEDGIALLFGDISMWYDYRFYLPALLSLRDTVSTKLRSLSAWSIVFAGAFVREQARIAYLPFRIVYAQTDPGILASFISHLPRELRRFIRLCEEPNPLKSIKPSNTSTDDSGIMRYAPVHHIFPEIYQNFEDNPGGIPFQLTAEGPVVEGGPFFRLTSSQIRIEQEVLQDAYIGKTSYVMAENAFMNGIIMNPDSIFSLKRL